MEENLPWVNKTMGHKHGGSLEKQNYTMSIHIGGWNTPKTIKNIFPCIKGSRGVSNLA